MGALVLLLVLSQSVKEDRSALRSGCAQDADQLATLPAGSPLIIRYALSGESTPCYKVAVLSGGKTVEGYLPATAIDGLEHFDQARREGAWLDTTQVMGAIRSSSRMGSPKAGIVDQAVQLIETSQPGRALELLDAEIRKRKDPALLAVAGVAAWRADDSRRAMEFWRSSLELQPNPDIENLYRKVEREAKADQSTEKVYGLRVILRFESATLPIDTARQMVSVLDEEFSRIATQLGCTAEERIVAIAQSRDAYRKTTETAEWNGGQYDGRIRVPVLEGQAVDRNLRRALAHEITHACLSMLGRFPAWLQEGLAQKFSGDTLAPAVRVKLGEMARQSKLPKLSNLGQDWSRLDTEHAVLAYALSLAAVEMFYQSYSEYGVANLLRNSERLGAITADLDKRLGL